MAVITRSNVAGVIVEDTEGTLKDLTAGSQFFALREGGSLVGGFNTLESDALVAGDIGPSKSFVADETPTGTINLYFKHSGVEGQEPEHGPFYHALMGDKDVSATEYDTVSGSTTTVLNVDTGEGAQYLVGQGVLVKDGTNGYKARTVSSITGDALTLNFALTSAPAAGVNLGKAVTYKPGTSHPTLSLHRHQAASSAAFKDAMAGVRVNNLSLTLDANGFAEGSFGVEGLVYYYDHLRVSTANNKLNFKDDGAGSELTITLDSQVYKTPQHLADAIASKMTAASVASQGDTYTVSFSSTTGKYTIATDGAFLSLLWKTGTNGSDNTDTHVGTLIGFADAADDTGSTSYLADTALDYSPTLTPAYDSVDNIVVKDAELLIGDQTSNICRKATSLSFAIDTPVTRVPSVCSESGVDSAVNNERTCTMTAQLVLEQHEVELMYKFMNNSSTQLQFVAGPKVAGNRVAGKTIMVTFLNCSITADTVGENDGYHVFDITAQGFVGATSSDCYINFL